MARDNRNSDFHGGHRLLNDCLEVVVNACLLEPLIRNLDLT